MTYAEQLTLGLYIFIIIPVMVIVVMEKRQPTKTVAWLLVLTFLPVIGLIFYFFFWSEHPQGALHCPS